VRVFSQQRGGLMYGNTRGTATVSGNTITFDPANNFKPGETVMVTTTTAATSTAGHTPVRGQVHQFTAGGGVGERRQQLGAVAQAVRHHHREAGAAFLVVDLDAVQLGGTHSGGQCTRSEGAG